MLASVSNTVTSSNISSLGICANMGISHYNAPAAGTVAPPPVKSVSRRDCRRQSTQDTTGLMGVPVLYSQDRACALVKGHLVKTHGALS